MTRVSTPAPVAVFRIPVAARWPGRRDVSILIPLQPFDRPFDQPFLPGPGHTDRFLQQIKFPNGSGSFGSENT